MRVFDSHVHIFPDQIAEKTVVMLGAEADIQPTYDGSRAGLRRSMQAAGIDGAMNCPIATKAEQVASINRWAVANNRWPVLSLGTMHPDAEHSAATLTQLKKDGLAGIKLHPEYQEFTMDDERLRPIWSACQTNGLVIVLHAGADIAFKPPYRSDPRSIRAVLEQFPDLDMVAAHFGSWRMWADVKRELIGRRVFLDLSFLFGELPDREIVDMIRAHDPERVLFATDAPWRDQKKDLNHFLELPLTADEQAAILWQNAAALFGFE